MTKFVVGFDSDSAIGYVRPRVNFINPFTLCAKLLRLKKASQKLGTDRKSVAQSVNGFMKSTPDLIGKFSTK